MKLTRGKGNKRGKYAHEKDLIFPRKEPILQKVTLYQQILLTPGQTQDAFQALVRAYARLSEQEKIAFLLAGGAKGLFAYQQWPPWQGQGNHAFSHPITESLPLLC